MVENGERLPLVLETEQGMLAGRLRPDEFERGPAAELVVVASGQVYPSHAATAGWPCTTGSSRKLPKLPAVP
jgi:hypothetical protein